MKNYLVNFFREYNKITAVSYNFKNLHENVKEKFVYPDDSKGVE